CTLRPHRPAIRLGVDLLVLEVRFITLPVDLLDPHLPPICKSLQPSSVPLVVETWADGLGEVGKRPADRTVILCGRPGVRPVTQPLPVRREFGLVSRAR